MNELKSLLLKIAALGKRDQRFLLGQLNEQHQAIFARHRGEQLLNTAQRFSHLPCPALEKKAVAPGLPECAYTLNALPPLYVAIILEQNQFSWEALFLSQYSQPNEIQLINTTRLVNIKPATKKAVLAQWEETLDFAHQLELDHGTHH